jgi:hypothetical protein
MILSGIIKCASGISVATSPDSRLQPPPANNQTAFGGLSLKVVIYINPRAIPIARDSG